MVMPSATSGLRHLALNVKNLEATVKFYVELLGMRIEWQPDTDNVYLTTGNDNLALHRAPADFVRGKDQVLDHLGFILPSIESVDLWHEFFIEKGVEILKSPKSHRDGARSFYCQDPDGNTVQMIYHPPLSKA